MERENDREIEDVRKWEEMNGGWEDRKGEGIYEIVGGKRQDFGQEGEGSQCKKGKKED